ncbi:MAG: hypothetical protein LBH28_10850 [Oscillospiraceae bacterium]|nr:hypothetical protein [Oscillospiraceae bacterium]
MLSVVAIHNLQIECRLCIDQILSFDMVAAKDSHARMQATLLISDCMRRRITEAFDGDTVAVWAVNESGGRIRRLFAGQIDDLHIDYEGDLEKVVIGAVSSSILLDTEKKSRSFQDISSHYSDVIYSVLADTNKAGARLHVQDMLLKKPAIQYEETDWQFIKRMASNLQASVIPDFSEALPRVHVGLKSGADIGEIECIKYKTGFDSRYYTDGKTLNLPKSGFLYYDVESCSLYNIGDFATFLGRKLRICELKYTLMHDMLCCIYRLATPAYFMIRQQYNDNLRGLSLQGAVLRTNRELVRIHLDIDDRQDPETAYDYTWRPETGNLMYCMPEPGTRVSLYMQNPDESCAICKDCVRVNGDQFPEAQSPEDRYLTTIHDKRMFWKPGEAGFTSLTANSWIKIDDAIGLVIDTSGGLLMQSGEDLTINGKRVALSAPKEISLVRRKVEAPTVINTCYNFDIVGNIGGFYTNKPPAEPCAEPQFPSVFGNVEEFDMNDIADMIIAAAPAGSESESTPISTALQGAFVAHMPHGKGRG